MSLAQEMWTYLKSIGFEDIPNNDDRLGAQGAPDAIHWEHTIARDNLCAFCNEPTGSYIFLSDLNNYNLRMPVRTNDINIHSVSDLERWLRKEYPEFFITKKPTKVSINTSLSDKVSPLEWAFNKSKTILGTIEVFVSGFHYNGEPKYSFQTNDYISPNKEGSAVAVTMLVDAKGKPLLCGK